MKLLKRIKFIFLFVILFSITISAQQARKGSFSLGGNLLYSHISQSVEIDYGFYGTRSVDVDYDIFNFDPSLTFFVSDNIGLGFQLAYQSINADDGDFSQLGIGPALEIYFGHESNKPFINFAFIVNSGDTEDSQYLGFGAGYNIAIARNVALQPAFQYRLGKPENGEFGDATILMLGIGVRTFIF